MKEIEIPSADTIVTDNHGNAHRFGKVAGTLVWPKMHHAHCYLTPPVFSTALDILLEQQKDL